jgi:hypothetical protein
LPNAWPPPTMAVGPSSALALTWSHTRHGRRERATRSRACTRPFPLRRTPFCTTSNVHSRDALA